MHTNVKKYTLAAWVAAITFMGLGYSEACRAIVFPTLISAQITSCEDGSKGPCSQYVEYSGTVAMIEIGIPQTKAVEGLPLAPFGIHCDDGFPPGNFTGCIWAPTRDHSPSMSNCNLAHPNTGDWTIANPERCSFGSTWGKHTGAQPGGECVMFGQGNMSSAGTPTITTPTGVYDATVAANAGNRFCIKAQPPELVCEMSIPPEIDHGEMPINGQDVVTITGSVNCGGSPVATIVGGGNLNLAKGVSTQVQAAITQTGQLVVTSNLTILGAEPGAYSSNVIIVVSPQ